MTYHTKKMEILNKLASGEKSWIHDQLDGTSLLEEALAELDTALKEASHAIDELFLETYNTAAEATIQKFMPEHASQRQVIDNKTEAEPLDTLDAYDHKRQIEEDLS